MARSTTRVQLELDQVRLNKLLLLEKTTGATTHSEAVRRVIDLGDYIRSQMLAGAPVDLAALQALFFTNLE